MPNPRNKDGQPLPNLIFSAVGDDGIKVTSNSIKGSGSKIHFSRIGLVRETPDFWKLLYPQDQKNDATILDKFTISNNLPKIDGYKYCKRPIRDGYIYICDQYKGKTECVIHEYRVENGRLRKIFWSEANWGKNVRVLSNKAEYIDYHAFLKDVEFIWIAYSEDQWAWKYVYDMWQKEDLRTKRFSCLPPQKWFDIVNHDIASNTQSYFPINSNAAYDAKWYWLPEQEKKKEVQAICSYFDNEHILVNERFTELTDKDVSIFFSVDDPLGCIEDISVDIADENSKIEAYQLSMQTEYSFDFLYDTIRLNKMKESYLIPDDYVKKAVDKTKTAEQDKDKNEGTSTSIANSLPTAMPQLRQQYEHLYTSALILYKMLFESEGKVSDSVSTYREAVSRDKIKKLLAVDERRECRIAILQMQKAMGQMLFSPYLQYVLADYLKNIDDKRVNGQIIYGQMLAAVNNIPRNKDRYLDVGNSPDSILEMQWMEETAKSIFYEDGEIPEKEEESLDIITCEPFEIGRALLGSKINYDDNETPVKGAGQVGDKGIETSGDTPKLVEIADRINVALYTIISVGGTNLTQYQQNHYKKIAQLEDRWKCMKQYTQKLNQYDKNKDKFVLRKANAKEWLNEVSNASKGKLRAKNLKKVNRELARLDDFEKAQKKAFEELEELELRSGKNTLSKIESPYIEYRRAYKKYDGLGTHKYFGSVLLGLSLLNLDAAISSFDSSTISRKTKTVLNIAAAGTELASIAIPFFPRFEALIHTHILDKAALRLGWGATGIASIVTIIDGKERLDAGDNDAAIAYFIAGTLGLTSAVSGLLLTASVAIAFTGPVALICLLLATIAVFIGIYNTDDDFETFLKYSVLGSRKHIDGNENAIRKMTPTQVKQELYLQRATLTGVYTRATNNKKSKGEGKSMFKTFSEWLLLDSQEDIKKSDLEIGLDLTDFTTMLRWIYDIMAGFSVKVKFKDHHNCSRTDWMKKQNLEYPRLIQFDLRYGNYGEIKNTEYELGIYNILGSGILAEQQRIDIPSPTIEEANYTNSIGNTLSGITLLLNCNVDSIFMKMAQDGQLGSSSRYVFFFRIYVDRKNELYWPYNVTDEILYIGLTEKIMNIRGKSRGRSRYDQDDRIRIQNPYVIIGTKEQILRAAAKF